MAYEDLPPRDAYQITQQGAPYIDVRTQGEFAQGHPEGAYNIPVFQMGPMGMTPNGQFVEVVKKHFDPGADLVLGCRSGARSAQACQMLRQAGFTGRLVNVAGGFLGGAVRGWADEGLPSTVDAGDRDYASLR